MDFPKPDPTPTHISSYQSLIAGRAARLAGLTTASPSSASWPLANLALFLPMYLPFPYNVARAYWVNGVTVTGNSDIGIYTPGGAKLWSAGSTAQSGSQALQYVTAGILLSPGWYYLGFVNDGTSSRVMGASVAQGNARVGGIVQQASALPLPSPATFAQYSQSGGVAIPVVGITRLASGF